MTQNKPYLDIIIDTCKEHSKSYAHNKLEDIYGVYQNVISAPEFMTLTPSETRKIKPILFNYLYFQNPNNDQLISFADLFEHIIYGLKQFEKQQPNTDLCFANETELKKFANDLSQYIHHPAISRLEINQTLKFMVRNFTSSTNFVYNTIRKELSELLIQNDSIPFQTTDHLYEILKQIEQDTIEPTQPMMDNECYGYRYDIMYDDWIETDIMTHKFTITNLPFMILKLTDLIAIMEHEIH